MSTFSKFYQLSRMANSCGIDLPSGVYVSMGGYSWNRGVSYSKDKVNIFVHLDDTWQPFANVYNVTISIKTSSYEDVTVYKDAWIHNIPKEMKVYVRKYINEIVSLNRWMKEIKVEKSYNNMLKQNKIEEKKEKIKKHEEEKQKLLKMFK